MTANILENHTCHICGSSRLLQYSADGWLCGKCRLKNHKKPVPLIKCDYCGKKVKLTVTYGMNKKEMCQDCFNAKR